MTTEQPEPTSMDSEDVKPTIPLEPEHEYRFQKGDKIADRYQVIASLGFGGFAEVYHCQDLELPRTVAVKVLTQKGMGLQEARAAVRLENPRIVQVIDISTLDNGTSLIIFRYVEGETLEACLNQAQYRRLPLNTDTLRIIQQISEALDYAHGQGVIHRDVKPSNIILDRQGNAYLTDFGLSEVKRPAEGESVLSAAVQHRLSGTIPYMAPEQLREETPGDARSDLYSLGVVVYEVLTGQRPYRGQDASLIFQIATSDPLPPTLANPELPQGVESVLLQALDKNPENRHSSCLAFSKELKEAAQAYVAASDQYEQARKLFGVKQWRDALDAFEALERKAPGFKNTAHYLEQARHQIRLLELYEQARKALKQGKYQDALDILNVLTQMDPDYDVADLRAQAREKLAQEEKRSLDEQYQQAVRQFKSEEYQACLDTLAVIRERDPNYSDPEEIERPAMEQVERQRRLREHYARGAEQMEQERWEEAIATFEKLQREAPGYEDVETRLEMARPMARLSFLLREAREFLDQGRFAACVDKLAELQQMGLDYKHNQVAQLRHEALNRLHEQANRLLQKERFEESLAALAELQARSSDYPDVKELEAQAREGIRIRDLQAELDGLYQQAVEHLDRRAYAEALENWEAIQRQREDLDYPDPLRVENRARDGLCMTLYNQALGALAQGEPQQALELWHRVRDVDPEYPDSQRVEERAQAMIERKGSMRWWGLRLGGGAVALLLVGILVAMIIRCWGPVPPTTVTPTWTPSPTSTTATPSLTPTVTATQSPSPTPTATPTPTRTPSPTPTPITGTLATALEGSGIFAAPDADSQVLGGISEGEQVLVLGRSAVGEWFYVRDDQGVEGFVYAPRFEWSGDYESLPVIAPSVAPGPVTYTPPAGPPYSTLKMDLWDIGEGWCSGGVWYKRVYIQGQGGNGVYTYYWNGERVAGPLTNEGYTFEVHSVGGALIGTGKVVSGDGQEVVMDLYIREPDCAQ